jgi:hypothetical protein
MIVYDNYSELWAMAHYQIIAFGINKGKQKAFP